MPVVGLATTVAQRDDVADVVIDRIKPGLIDAAAYQRSAADDEVDRRVRSQRAGEFRVREASMSSVFTPGSLPTMMTLGLLAGRPKGERYAAASPSAMLLRASTAIVIPLPVLPAAVSGVA